MTITTEGSSQKGQTYVPFGRKLMARCISNNNRYVQLHDITRSYSHTLNSVLHTENIEILIIPLIYLTGMTFTQQNGVPFPIKSKTGIILLISEGLFLATQ